MNVERVMGVGAVLFAIPVTIISWGFGIGSMKSPGAGFWPLGIAVIIFVLGALMAISPQLNCGKSDEGKPRWLKLILTFISVVVYAALLMPLGYFLTTTVLMFAQLRWVEDYSWKTSSLVAVLTSAISFILFRVLLKVSLPSGIIIPMPFGW